MPLLQWASQVTPVVKNLCVYAGDSRDSSLIPGSGRSPGEGNGHPHQYSWLEKPIDRGARKATVHGVAKSWTRLMQLSILSKGKTLGSHSVLTYGETSLSIFCQFSWIHCPYSLNIIILFDKFPLIWYQCIYQVMILFSLWSLALCLRSCQGVKCWSQPDLDLTLDSTV